LDTGWLCVDAPLTAFDELEVFHGIGDVDLLPVQAAFVHGFAQQASSGTDKRVPFDVFLVARLLAHHDDLRVAWTFPKNDLRRMLVEVTAAAARGGLAQLTQSAGRRNKRRCGSGLTSCHLTNSPFCC